MWLKVQSDDDPKILIFTLLLQYFQSRRDSLKLFCVKSN